MRGLTRGTAIAIALGASLAACGERPTPRSYVERAVALAPEIERTTGMRFVSPPKVEVRTSEQVRTFVERQMQDSLVRADVASIEAAYKRLGLIPDSMSLSATLARLLTAQIVGYYDPGSKTLYVVDGADSAATDVTLRHELVHALQDQHVNVDSIERVAGANDRASAAHAALEGQASYAQFASNGIAMMAPGAWDRVRSQIRDNMERTPALADAPFVVRETLLFPYLSGAEFARRFENRGGADSLLGRLPASTEQVLHAASFFGRAAVGDTAATGPDAPTVVTLPAPSVGTILHQNTFGEFQARLFFFHHLEDLDESARASMGWDGDRFAIVRTPQGDAFVWLTVWDGSQDAAEFYDAMGQLIPHRYPDAKLVAAPPAGVTAKQYTAGGGRSLLLRAGDVAGRPVVLYVDAPPGVATDLVDLARVTLRE